FYEYDPNTDTWSMKSDVPGPTRQEACGFAMNGSGYIGTGDDYSSGTNYDDWWRYRPETDTWDSVPEFPGIGRRYMSAFTIDNHAYCGLGTSGTNMRDLWELKEL
ncbi:MAG: kelch repeat-containing protein, partial [Chitinophagales bacterium]